MQGAAMETNRDSTTADPAEEPQPNLAELATFLKEPLDIRSIALSGLFLLAVFGTLYVARSVFMPVVLAFLSLVASLGQKPLGQDVSQVEKARIILKCN
jgi:hypothetical protein